jgi:hypothetical protein
MIVFDNPIPRDWFDWTNATVGGVGLLLTLLAIRQATGAKQAASEAREAVYQRNSAEAFAELVRLAEQISESLLLEKPNAAAVRARDLAARIPRDRSQFEQFLAADSDKLKALESVFQQVAIRLSSPGFLDRRDEPQRTIEEIFDAKRDLHTIHGRLLAHSMRRDHE